MNHYAHKIPKWAVGAVAFVGLLVATLPANIAWYHTTGTNSSLSFPAVFGVSMFFVIIEYLIILPSTQLAGSRFSLTEVNIIEYVTLTMGSLFYLLVVRRQSIGLRQYLGLFVTVGGSALALV